VRNLLRHRLRHPVAAVAGWATAVSCACTPWLLEPPLWVRFLAALVAGLTTWAAVRALGALAGLVRGVLRGEAPRVRFAAGLALLLAVGGWSAAPAGASEAPPVVAVSGVVPTGSGAGPLSVRVPLDAADTDAARARVAVTELVRGGGLARSTVLVAVPTGSGWVDEGAVRGLETVTGGDVAMVTVQYAARPSWVEYLRGQGAATRSAVAVLAAVRAQLATVPPDRRPRLLVFGESLGATAAAAALQATGPVDGCLLVGRPGSADEKPVRGCLEVRNDDDPIPWWRPGLLVAPRPGLPWLPVATFWQVTGSLVSALDQPDGHGHRYGARLASSWTTLLGAAGVASGSATDTCSPPDGRASAAMVPPCAVTIDRAMVRPSPAPPL
jgi:hypothetical protein